MKIITWNVNSIRARIEILKDYLKLNSPDLVLLQEIKTEEVNYPFNEIKKLGYISYVSGQKSYNGVSILSKKKLNSVKKNLSGDKIKQARIITAKTKIKNNNIEIINIYIPNGNPVNTDKYTYKLSWMDLFIKEVEKKIKKGEKLIIGGDFNVIPESIDVHNPEKYEKDALFKLEIRKKFRMLLNLGLHDVYRYFFKDKQEYTFWDYTSGSWPKDHGMRIDHFLVSNEILNNIKAIRINKKPRSKIKPSDHTPLEMEIN